MHGDGRPTRRYLFAADATDAFDTILHKGEVGQVYNIGSYDEISNLALCHRLLVDLSVPHDISGGFSQWIQYTHDRPFNDHRYAVDDTKLRKLGWEQKTSLEQGLKITVDWYRRFGEEWWGDVTKALCPYPIVVDGCLHSDEEDVTDVPQPATATNREWHKPRREGQQDLAVGNFLR